MGRAIRVVERKRLNTVPPWSQAVFSRRKRGVESLVPYWNRRTILQSPVEPKRKVCFWRQENDTGRTHILHQFAIFFLWTVITTIAATIGRRWHIISVCVALEESVWEVISVSLQSTLLPSFVVNDRREERGAGGEGKLHSACQMRSISCNLLTEMENKSLQYLALKVLRFKEWPNQDSLT